MWARTTWKQKGCIMRRFYAFAGRHELPAGGTTVRLFYHKFAACKEQCNSAHEDTAFHIGCRALASADVLSGFVLIGRWRPHKTGSSRAALGARFRLQHASTRAGWSGVTPGMCSSRHVARDGTATKR
ncbi:hypothetical protein, unlikely [Trypanosoma congolense IL3000]|uniref:Uncharacterized protein n=1 Tax=Trypanosoma congolense (strain IL3000) TaxID=1068625 RepID=F9WCB6_TRYCI|nr:hypothetical protein, unlikely [Trypanosoma congolense IL3000]CCD14909.1 hypothetical protein, unlikely [Trypanosoma congolense IL3000]